MLSDSPPERDLDWSESGIEGAWRHAQRVWRLVSESVGLPGAGAPAPDDMSDAAVALRRSVHKAIKAVTDGIDNFRFNTAVAQIYELTNAINSFKPDAEPDHWALREALETLVRLSEPMMPHLAEEAWAELGHTTPLFETAWPEADPALLVQDSVTLGVQVSGKMRDTITVPAGADEAACTAIAYASPKVQAAMDGKEPRKVIYVPGRILNIVV
jgi:leucyl-tRNA synthetase